MEKASPKNNYHYNKNLKKYARKHRNHSTKGEIYFWNDVLKKKFTGYQFYRQRPVLNYIADFIYLDLMLIIEIDGDTHLDPRVQEKDRIRQKALEAVGFTVLRYTDREVFEQLAAVMEDLYAWILAWEKENGVVR